ncbi:hypothetical protein FQN51_008723, partial [Onygenales sp. PD_10]
NDTEMMDENSLDDKNDKMVDREEDHIVYGENDVIVNGEEGYIVHGQQDELNENNDGIHADAINVNSDKRSSGSVDGAVGDAMN